MDDKFILDADGKTPIPADLMTWAKWCESNPALKIVKQEEVHGVKVSTVFLSLDHSFGHGPPVLWETMIFGGEHDEYQERYSTYDDAVAGHQKAVEMVRG